ASVRAADEGVAISRAALRPQIGANAGASVADESDGLGASTSVSGSIDGTLLIYDGGATFAATDAAQANVLAARESLRLTEQDVLLATVTAYNDILASIRFVELSRSNVRVLTEELQAAQDRFEVGEVTRTDVAQARARVEAARAELAANTGILAIAREAFLAVVGEPAVDLAPPPPIPPLPATREEAETIAMRRHPALGAARFAEQAATFEVAEARAAFRPNVSLTGSVGVGRTSSEIGLPGGSTRVTSSEADVSAGIVASVPIYTGGANSAGVRLAIANVEAAKSDLQDTARTIRQLVGNAWAELRVARASIQASREGIRAARIAFEGVREEALLGARTTLDVLDAEEELLEAQVTLADAERDEYVAAYELLSAMGLLSVAHLGLSVEEYDPTVNYDRVQGGPVGGFDGSVVDRIRARFRRDE
ncbi:MAG: TolC family outer membrane protein, partial [Pseudomonadota bacterium]